MKKKIKKLNSLTKNSSVPARDTLVMFHLTVNFIAINQTPSSREYMNKIKIFSLMLIFIIFSIYTFAINSCRMEIVPTVLLYMRKL